MKLQSRLLGTFDKVEFEFLRLSLPLCCHDKFTPRYCLSALSRFLLDSFLFRHITLERRQIALHEYIESQEEKRAFAFPLTASLPGTRSKSIAPGNTDTMDSHLTNQTDTNPNFLSPDSITHKSARNPTNLLVKFRDQTSSKKSPTPSPPSTPLMNGSSQTHLANGTAMNESTDRLNKSNMKTSTSKLNNFFHLFSKEPQDPQAKNAKRTIKLSGNSTTSTGTNLQVPPQSVLKVPTINSLSAAGGANAN